MYLDFLDDYNFIMFVIYMEEHWIDFLYYLLELVNIIWSIGLFMGKFMSMCVG